MSKYQKYQSKTKEALKSKGSEIIVVHSLEEVYNTETNEYETVEVKNKGYALQSSFDFKNVNGTTVQVGDIVLMASLEIEPCIGDKALYGGKEYKVVNFNTENPDGNCVIYYELLCR